MQLLAAAELVGVTAAADSMGPGVIATCAKCKMKAHGGACNMKAATIEAGIRENMEDHPKGGLKCKLCGARTAHPRAAAAHLAVHHRDELEAYGTSEGVKKAWDSRGRGKAMLQNHNYHKQTTGREWARGVGRDGAHVIKVKSDGSWTHRYEVSGEPTKHIASGPDFKSAQKHFADGKG